MATISNSVFDAALGWISTNCNRVEVQNASAALLVTTVLDGSNYSAAGDNSGSGGGRKKTCLVSDTSDMQAIAVSSAGSATKVAIGVWAGSAFTGHIVASIASAPVAIGASDSVNLGTFDVILKDPS